MKKITISVICLTIMISSFAQQTPKILDKAIINTKISIATDDNAAGNENQQITITTDNGEERKMPRFNSDGDTKVTTWISGNMTKTFSENEMSRSTIIRDNDKKLTTTIAEMMGKKTAFYATDDEQVIAGKQMDSLLTEFRKNMPQRDNNAPNVNNGGQTTIGDIVYKNETQKIAGIVCKKALIPTKSARGKMDTLTVWYNPDVKLLGKNTIEPAGSGGFGGMMMMGGANNNANLFEKLNGLPMQYVRNMGRGRTKTVTVTKLVTDKEIAAKEFEIPKGVELKTMKEMQASMPRIGGGNVNIRTN